MVVHRVVFEYAYQVVAPETGSHIEVVTYCKTGFAAVGFGGYGQSRPRIGYRIVAIGFPAPPCTIEAHGRIDFSVDSGTKEVVAGFVGKISHSNPGIIGRIVLPPILV